MHGRANLTAMRLMDACEHLLCEAETLEDLTARRIAIEAHATPSAISYHFGSQEELVAAVAERVYRRLNAERLSLLRIAPWLAEVDIGWRLNCALGIRSQVTRSRSRTEVLTNYSIDLDDPDTVIARMVEVIAPMFRR